MSKMPSILHVTAATAICIAFAASTEAQADISDEALLGLSLEQLSNLEVTSVSKKAEKANEAPAAIFVLTADDIRRLGATSIPEALRVVPGMNVARSGSHQWAVTSRGFNDQFANKMLVLIDGRTIYTPHFSGVWWDAQDVVLEDIERIEVIRGPGATLWGANAVNGVINIITKNSKDTQGSMVSMAAGTLDRALVTGRHGARLGEDAYVRAYVKYTNRDEVRTLSDTGADDAWNNTQAGFRADWKQSASDNVTLQGDIYTMHADFVWGLPSFVSPPVTLGAQEEHAQGFNVLGRWNHEFSKESNFTVQTYFDYSRRSDVVYKDAIDTFDIEFQHVWTGFDRHEVIWGVGYRLVMDDFRNTPYYSITNPTRDDSLFNAFVQDKIALVPDEFFLTLGSKFEKNNYTSLEVQPSARLSWLIDDRQMFWTAVSHAVKSPNRTLDDANLAVLAFPPGAEDGFLSRFGSHSFDSEELTAYEVGYRIQPVNTVSLDATAFRNRYSDLILGALGTPFLASDPLFPSPYLIYPVLPLNGNSASSHGVEVTGTWDVMPSWQLSASYSYLKLKFSQIDALGFAFGGKEPQQQFNLRSTALLPYDLELNNVLYFVDSLTGARIPNYFRFDTRLGWKPMDGLELSLVGQNLLDSEHPEFSGFIFQNASQIPRSVYGMVTVRF